MGDDLNDLFEGSFDPMLPSQFFEGLRIREPDDAEGRIAWRKLHRDACDCVFGSPKQRLIYIKEVWDWIFSKTSVYSFDWWASRLDPYNLMDRSFIRDGLLRFLQTQRLDAINKMLGKTSTTNDAMSVLKGRKGSAAHPSMAHLPQRAGKGYGCSRCEQFVTTLDDFERLTCQGEASEDIDS